MAGDPFPLEGLSSREAAAVVYALDRMGWDRQRISKATGRPYDQIAMTLKRYRVRAGAA